MTIMHSCVARMLTAFALSALPLTSCDCDGGNGDGDSGAADAHVGDAASIDTARADAGRTDTGRTDTNRADARQADAGNIDAGGGDATSTDSGSAVDASTVEDAGPSVWHWENPQPAGWGVFGLWGTSSTNVHAVGTYGNLLHWDGLSWQEEFVGDQGDYAGIWGSSASDVFVVGESLDQILHFDGTTWAPMTQPAALPMLALWGASDSDVYAVGGRYWSGQTHGAIVHYDGDAWTVVRDDFTTILRAVWGSGAGDLFIGGDSGTLLRYDGTNFTPVTGATGNIVTILGFGASDDVLVFSDAGTCYRYDRGLELLSEDSQPGAVYGAWGRSLSEVYAAAGTTVQSYDGASWSPLTLPADASGFSYHAVWGTADGNLFVGGYGVRGWDAAALLRRVDTQWFNDSSLLTRREFRDVWALSSTLAYAVGDQGTFARWDGTAWSLVDLGTATDLYGVWPASADNIFVTSRSDTIYRWQGNNWAPEVIAGAADLRHVRGTSGSNVYIAGGGYGVPELHHFDGDGWTAMTVPTSFSYIDDLWLDPATATLVVVGNTNDSSSGVYFWSPSAQEWTRPASALFTAVRAVSGTELQNLYVGTSDDIFRWNGTEWTPQAANPSTGYFTGLWARSADDIWAVGYDSVIMHSDGNAWSTIQNRNSGWELFAVHGTSASDVIVVGESGTILRYSPLP